MKTNPALAFSLAALITAVSPALAANYTDSTGDIGVGSGYGVLDITSVVVNNDASQLTFKINLAGDPTATDWGKYMIGIDSVPGGDPSGNGWGRPIGMSSGMDYFIGSWVDYGNGAEIRNWTGSAWNLQDATYSPNPDNLAITKDTSSVTLSFNYAGLGLSAGSTFAFDIYTSGGGGTDPAIDALGNPNPSVTSWSGSYNSGNLVDSYTIIAVPEPGIGGILALGSIVLWHRSRKA